VWRPRILVCWFLRQVFTMRQALERYPRSPRPRSRPTAGALTARHAKRPGERSERLWTHGDIAVKRLFWR
jgi:hypothetical protein